MKNSIAAILLALSLGGFAHAAEPAKATSAQQAPSAVAAPAQQGLPQPAATVAPTAAAKSPAPAKIKTNKAITPYRMRRPSSTTPSCRPRDSLPDGRPMSSAIVRPSRR